jgi:hypothetical protein
MVSVKLAALKKCTNIPEPWKPDGMLSHSFHPNVQAAT